MKDALLDSCRDEEEGGHGGDSSSGMELSVSLEKSSSDSSGEDEEDETMNVAKLKRLSSVLVSDVPAPAWPESPGFGLALLGSGFVKWEAKPKAKKSAWLGLALA